MIVSKALFQERIPMKICQFVHDLAFTPWHYFMDDLDQTDVAPQTMACIQDETPHLG